MHNEAGDRFQTLLSKAVPTGVRIEPVHLAQVWYARGYLTRPKRPCADPGKKLSPELEARKTICFNRADVPGQV